MYPEHLKTQYWQEVATLLVDNERSNNDVATAVESFKHRLAADDTGDLIYHQDPKRTADAIRKMLTRDLPTSDEVRSQATKHKAGPVRRSKSRGKHVPRKAS
jgi:hypothetical protein